MVWGPVESNEDESPLLTKEDLGGPSAQEAVGQKRLTGLIKELSANTRKYEIQGTDTEYATGKTTNDAPQQNNSPIGSTKNTLQRPRGK